jgi:hypothetical protein
MYIHTAQKVSRWCSQLGSAYNVFSMGVSGLGLFFTVGSRLHKHSRDVVMSCVRVAGSFQLCVTSGTPRNRNQDYIG